MNKQQAMAAGRHTYIGTVCKEEHDPAERYVISGACVQCCKDHAQRQTESFSKARLIELRDERNELKQRVRVLESKLASVLRILKDCEISASGA